MTRNSRTDATLGQQYQAHRKKMHSTDIGTSPRQSRSNYMTWLLNAMQTDIPFPEGLEP